MVVATIEYHPESTFVSASKNYLWLHFDVLVYIAFVHHIQNFASGEFSM